MKKSCLLQLLAAWLVVGMAHSQEYYLEKVWETDAVFRNPESVVFDPVRKLLYVSNFNRIPSDPGSADDCISVLDLDGNLLEPGWICGLKAPCGMCIHKDRLFVGERDGISVFDIGGAERIRKYQVKAGFLNDVATDEQGIIYYTDTSPRKREASTVCAIRDGKADTIADEPIIRANGLTWHEGALLVGNSGDMKLKSIDLASREVSCLAKLDTGIIDGIKSFRDDTFLVSHWDGNLYLVSVGGEVTELIDTREERINFADFEYIPELQLIVVPTFLHRRVIAFRIRLKETQP